MSKYYPVYKCHLCGTIQRGGEPQEIPYDQFPILCAKIVQRQQFISNSYIKVPPMQIPHQCPDGSCGMSYFAGFKKFQ